MIKRTVITAVLATIVAGSSCSGKNSSNEITFNPFYTGPDEVISQISKQSEDSLNNYILAKAYQKKNEYKSAILYYANSCYTSKFNFSLRLFPHPVYSFLDSYSSKSPYYNDAVYEIASIFYQYNEHEYVVKFVSLLKDDGSALYRDAIILKSKSLQKAGKNSEAIKELLSLEGRYSDSGSVTDIFMRLGSVFESEGRLDDAVSAYLNILKSETEAWHDDVAVKRILYLVSEKKVKITEPESRLAVAEALFKSKDYSGAESWLPESFKEGGNTEADLLLMKILSRRKYSGSVKLLKKYEKSPDYDRFALAHANELWDGGNKYAAVQAYVKIAGSPDREIADRVLTRLSFYYEERGNPEMLKYMEMYRRLFPEKPLSGRFTWLMGRYYLKSDNHSSALQYFQQGIKKYPDNPYTANCRYWFFKISHNKKTPSDEEKLDFLADLALNNPESAHTLSLLSDYAQKLDTARATALYEKVKKEGNSRLMFLYHTILFMKEGYTPSLSIRFRELDSDYTEKFKSFNRFFEGGALRSGYGKPLMQLEKYFIAGDIESVNREIRIIPDNDTAGKIDIALALSRLASRYGHFNYSTFYSFRLLDYMKVQENLPLLSYDVATALYPAAFKECVIQESRRSRIQPELLFSMMKAESNFNTTAVSPVGAAGLMQLMPLTAKGIAKEMGITSYNLKDPCTSVKFGAHYLAWLDRYYKGKLEFMVAGYNAGPGNVNTWISRFSDREIDYMAEFTPFYETRDYIFRTRRYMVQYRSIYITE